jgi:hypothetical protein
MVAFYTRLPAVTTESMAGARTFLSAASLIANEVLEFFQPLKVRALLRTGMSALRRHHQ